MKKARTMQQRGYGIIKLIAFHRTSLLIKNFDDFASVSADDIARDIGPVARHLKEEKSEYGF